MEEKSKPIYKGLLYLENNYTIKYLPVILGIILGCIFIYLLEYKFCDFIQRCFDKYGLIGYTYCDSAEQVLIRGIRNAVNLNGTQTIVKNAIKMPIIDRIRLVVKLLQ